MYFPDLQVLRLAMRHRDEESVRFLGRGLHGITQVEAKVEL